ncbi:MAG: hypothetical protein ABR607_00695 [Pyrinomonadaceae bacterium]
MSTRSLLLSFAILLMPAAAMGQPKVSPDEQKMAQAIAAAPDTAAKAKAAADFVKKYPKSALRPMIAQKAAYQIREITDSAQKIALAQQFQTIFNNPAEAEMIMPVLLIGYSEAKRPDDAFSTGATYLGSHPDSVGVLAELMIIATEQAKQKNGKFVAQGEQYGTHAIELIEANKKPESMDDATWKDYKDVLPKLYQSLGIIVLVKGDRAATQARLTKAIELDPKDPFNYLLLSGTLNDDYQESAKHYKSMPDGPPKTAELQKALGTLDRVIDAYAHFIALSDGVAQFASVRQQEMQDLESYYKYRHNNTTAGLAELIEKYKTPVKP